MRKMQVLSVVGLLLLCLLGQGVLAGGGEKKVTNQLLTQVSLKIISFSHIPTDAKTVLRKVMLEKILKYQVSGENALLILHNIQDTGLRFADAYAAEDFILGANICLEHGCSLDLLNEVLNL